MKRIANKHLIGLKTIILYMIVIIVHAQSSQNVTLVSDYTTAGTANGVTVSGNYAFVADDLSGLLIISVSDPSNPFEIGYCNTPDRAYGVAISGNYAYVAAGNSGLRVIDISTLSNPTEVGYYITPSYAYAVTVNGNYAYVADYNAGMRIIDISDYSNLTEVGYDASMDARYIVLKGNYAYIAGRFSGLIVDDISNFSNITEIGHYDTPSEALWVALSGNYAYVSDHLSGLQIIDVSNPSNPFLVSTFTTLGSAECAEISGNNAYIAEENTNGLEIVNIANPTSPSSEGYYNSSDAARIVALYGNYAYTASYNAGLLIFQYTGGNLVPGSIIGTISDASTNTPITNANLTLVGNISNTYTNNSGYYNLSASPGIYTLNVQKQDYMTVTVTNVTIVSNQPTVENVLLQPLSPHIFSVSLTPSTTQNNGADQIALRATINNQSGLSNVTTVIADLSSIGQSSNQTMYDDGHNGRDLIAGDGVYTWTFTVNSSGFSGTFPLIVSAYNQGSLYAQATAYLTVTTANDTIFSGSTTIGLITINASHFTSIGQQLYTAHGNVVINGVIHCNSDLTLDYRNAIVQGTGQIYIPGTPIGTIQLYNGTFSFNATNAITQSLTSLEQAFNISGFNISVDSIQLTYDGVSVTGNLAYFPQFNVNSGSSNSSFSTEFTVSVTSTNGIQINDFFVDVHGPLYIPSTPEWSLSDLTVYIYNNFSIVSGSGTINTNILSVSGNCQFINGQINELGVTVTDNEGGIPIDGLPVELYSASGQVSGLVTPPLQFELGAGIGAPPGGCYLVDAQGNVVIDLSGYIEGSVAVGVFKCEGFGGYAIGDLSASIGSAQSQKPGIQLTGDVNISNILVASGNLQYDINGNLSGSVNGDLQIPTSVPILGGYEFGDIDVTFSNDQISGSFTQDAVSFLNPISFSFDTSGNFNFAVNWISVSIPLTDLSHDSRVARGINPYSPLANYGVSVPAGLTAVSFNLTWQTGSTDFYLIDPNGVVIDSTYASVSSQFVNYLQNPYMSEILYVVSNPTSGTWQEVVSDDSGIGTYNIYVQSPSASIPVLALLTPDQNTTGGQVEIDYYAADSGQTTNFSLYYSNSSTGSVGWSIVTALTVSNSTGSYQWNTDSANVPTGNYYVFGILDDGINGPLVAYAPGMVSVINPLAPATPQNLTAYPGQSNVVLTWSDNTESYLGGYQLYYQTSTSSVQQSVKVGFVTQYTLNNLPVASIVTVSLAALDTAGRQSPPTIPMAVTVSLPTTSTLPLITSQPITTAYVLQSYQYQVTALDTASPYLAIGLIASPLGMTITTSGNITWTPVAAETGSQSVVCIARDIYGNFTTQSFQVTVYPYVGPAVASNPVPYNNATSVSITTILQWTPVSTAVTYDVYFGTTSNPPPVLLSSPSTNYQPGNLQYGKNYYWYVVAIDPYYVMSTSALWTFQTQSAVKVPDWMLYSLDRKDSSQNFNNTYLQADMDSPYYRGHSLFE